MRFFKNVLLLLLCVAGFVFIMPASHAAVSVTCSSPTVTAPVGGGTVTSTVTCIITVPILAVNYLISPSTSNQANQSSVSLTLSGAGSLTASRQSAVVSPDGSVYNIAGTSGGFTGNLTTSLSSSKTIEFTYTTTTLGTTPAGTYQSSGSSAYQYQVCGDLFCITRYTGNAAFSLSVTVPSTPTSVSCTSQSVNATPGGGSFTIPVICTTSAGNATHFTPSSTNIFSPMTITFIKSNANINATLQSTVTSPDGSVTGITGTAGGGFTGTIISNPAKVQVNYTGTTTSTTSGGTYTSTPVSYVWSTL